MKMNYEMKRVIKSNLTLLYRHLVIPLVFINKVGTICQIVFGIT